MTRQMRQSLVVTATMLVASSAVFVWFLARFLRALAVGSPPPAVLTVAVGDVWLVVLAFAAGVFWDAGRFWNRHTRDSEVRARRSQMRLDTAAMERAYIDRIAREGRVVKVVEVPATHRNSYVPMSQRPMPDPDLETLFDVPGATRPIPRVWTPPVSDSARSA